MKVGLVLEGGAMRGMFTAGVLDVFLDNDIHADCVVGVSAGALFGVNFLSGQKGRVIRYNKHFNADKDYLGVRPLLREGNIVSTEYAYDLVPHVLDPFDDEAFQNSGVPFYAVVTQLESGDPEYIRVDSVFEQMDVLRASGSMPFVSRPVEINGKEYLDGGIADSIPYEWMLQQGCDKVIVVLTQDAAYRKKPSGRSTVLYMHKYPHFAMLLKSRYLRYNDSVEQLCKLEEAGKAFVIRPSSPIRIGKIEKDPEKLQEIYDLGVKDASSALDGLKAFLA